MLLAVRVYMLLAGWEVRIGKNCDRGLENTARGLRTLFGICIKLGIMLVCISKGIYDNENCHFPIH